MYPSTIHACINGNDHWDEAAPLITKTLADIGYYCGLAGKFHLSSAMAHEPELRPKDDGYRRFWYSHAPHQGIGKGNQYTDWLTSIGQEYRKLKKKYGYIPAKWHQTTWCADRTIEFIKEKHNKPWLFSVNIYDPHGPFDPPQEYIDRFDIESLPGPLFRESDLNAQEQLAEINFQGKARRPSFPDAKLTLAKYWAQIELIDENIGRILEALEKSGQRENTVIIFTSDHGEMAGDHGLNKKGCRFYEGLVRVPLIFSWPGHIEQGLRSDALVELVDIVPTLLELTGLLVPDTIQGKSLLPILKGKADPDKHREFVRCVYYKVLQGPESYATMLRNRRYKIVNYHGHALGELFDLKMDPYEFNNLWENPAYADVRFKLMKKSFDALAFAVDTGPPRVGRY
jgi:arylsulfatase A-like enzyme